MNSDLLDLKMFCAADYFVNGVLTSLLHMTWLLGLEEQHAVNLQPIVEKLCDFEWKLLSFDRLHDPVLFHVK